MVTSPLAPHAASPTELQARQRALRCGSPFLEYRTPGGDQRIVLLGDSALIVGRRETCDIPLVWDKSVSRAHARFERFDREWTVVDDGLSTNGTFVNGARLAARRRLCDGDVIEVGDTVLAFCAPVGSWPSEPTLARVTAVPKPAPDLTPAQRRVVTALCRPLLDDGVPASNQQIADELFVGVDAVKRTMKALFAVFAIDDLPQNHKRTALARAALSSGAI